ncbi:PEGA domain-containing protein [Chitinivibrio alkaliphilus]|uniref:PEGA domain-containing protein n=1 Tax=Chitinivibrio alkaliphilus ACht1 TaxID=1313304 RepID=U7D5Y7_9BACT|nr:PEGA domain-containing protein [Chitinivibrio alkaliphilus]ERP31343.1 hypothetical protein CALK_1833 [Chitinivibrio alkaliphilus ACht1]
MITSKSFLCIICLFLFVHGGHRIAIMDIEYTGLTAGQGVMITDKIRDEVGGRDVFVAISRSDMRSIMEESQFHTSGVVRGEDLVEMGSIYGAEYIVVGSGVAEGGRFQISLRVVNVSTGEEITVTEANPTTFSAFLDETIPVAVNRLETLVKKRVYGKLALKTTPPNAEVSLRGTSVGKTPFESDFLSPNTYPISLSLRGYETVYDTLSVAAGAVREYSYQMIPIDEIVSSEEHGRQDVSRERFGRGRRPVRIGLSVVSAGFLIGGIISNNEMEDDIDTQQGLIEELSGTTDPHRRSQLKHEIRDLDGWINDFERQRNIFYSISGAAALGLTLTFVF